MFWFTRSAQLCSALVKKKQQKNKNKKNAPFNTAGWCHTLSVGHHNNEAQVIQPGFTG